MFGRQKDKPSADEPESGGPAPDPTEGWSDADIAASIGAGGVGGGGVAGDAQAQIDQLAREKNEAITQWKRALADFQNYQRRALQNELEAKRQGAQGVLHSILPVLDHFDLALTQATPDESSRRILDGVKVIRQELLKALESNGVTVINPQPGDEFDPSRHAAIMQQAAEGVEPGRVSATFQPGYILGDRVIRSAKVAVAP